MTNLIKTLDTEIEKIVGEERKWWLITEPAQMGGSDANVWRKGWNDKRTHVQQQLAPSLVAILEAMNNEVSIALMYYPDQAQCVSDIIQQAIDHLQGKTENHE